jgi:hypothetical protein
MPLFLIDLLMFCLIVVSTNYGYYNINTYVPRKDRGIKCDIGRTGFEPVTP